MTPFRLNLVIGTALTLVASTPAFAQTAPTGASAATPATPAPAASAASPAIQEGGIADIIVTARKISESIQTTPVAISALTTDSLVKSSITNVSQLSSNVPSLTIGSAVAQPGSATLFIRGQGSTDGLLAIDQAVGTYLDGVYSARSSGGAFELVDIGRVEVLRGPQGTLFGRNTTGGAISLISNQPVGKLEGSARFDYGNYDAWLARGVLNVPIVGDQFAVRAAYQHREHGAYGYNVTRNVGVGGERSDYGRVSVKVAPDGSHFSALVVGDYSYLSTSNQVTGLKSFTPSSTLSALAGYCNGAFGSGAQSLCPVALPAGTTLANFVYGQNGNNDIYRVANDTLGFGNARSEGLAATLSYELSTDVTLKSITGWRNLRTLSRSDNDGTPYLLSGAFALSDGNQITQHQFSQEIQLAGKSFDQRLSWILGGFYFTEHGMDESESASLYPLSTAIGITDGTVRNKSYAGFAQATFNVTDAVRLTGGLRYTKDKRDISIRNGNRNAAGVFTGGFKNPDGSPATVAGLTLDPGDPNRYNGSVSKGYLSYTASLDWQAQRGVFLYAKTSSATRSGGFNTRAAAGGVPPVSFNPERVTDYEIGGKFDAFDRHVRLNVAAYYSKISSLQRNLIGVIVGTTTLTSGAGNAGSAHVWGGEAELTVIPVKGLTLGATLGLTYPKYDSFINPINGANFGGTPFPYTPKGTFSLSGDYETAVGSFGTVNFHLDYSHKSKAYAIGLVDPSLTTAQNAALQETSALPAYGLLNARVSFTLDNPNIEIALFARNITKAKYFTRLLDVENTPLGFTSYVPGDPRTYGISTIIKF
ncbi:MAG: tonB dependent receptor family protein [Bradyrhizobium sp.]|nr:tonB dependent receptor family protein [Bradyrhizobium sp.]